MLKELEKAVSGDVILATNSSSYRVTEITEDSKEGFRAAAEKREPVYTGK